MPHEELDALFERLDADSSGLISINELIGPLAKEEPIYAEMDKEMRNWYLKTLDMGPPVVEKPKKEKGGKKKK